MTKSNYSHTSSVFLLALRISLCTRHPSAALQFLRSHLVQQSWRLLILGARCRVWLFSLAFPDVVSVGWSEGRQSSGTAGFWCSVSVAGGRTATAAQSTMLICMFALNFKGQPFFFFLSCVYFKLIHRENEAQFETIFVSSVLSRPRGQRTANSPGWCLNTSLVRKS